MTRRLITLFQCVCSVACLSLGPASAQDTEAIALSRRDIILTELLQAKDHPWAGEYEFSYRPWGSERQLLISPNAGSYHRVTCGCTGVVLHSSGIVSLALDAIKIDWDADNTTLPDSEILIPVRWRTKDYLIPRRSVLQFCVAARKHKELPAAWVRLNSAPRIPLQTPVLPDSYKKYVEMDHIGGTITEFMQQERKWLMHGRRIRLDIGANDGLLPDMRLYPTQREVGPLVRVTVEQVDRDESEAIISSPTLSTFAQFQGVSVTTDRPQGYDEP